MSQRQVLTEYAFSLFAYLLKKCRYIVIMFRSYDAFGKGVQTLLMIGPMKEPALICGHISV